MNNIPCGEKQDFDILTIYPGYTQFRSLPVHNLNMNISNPDFKGFKHHEEKTIYEIYKRDELRLSVRSGEHEERCYIQPPSKKDKESSKRGIITNMSQKSSIRCRKTLARMYELSLWVDFTFADDVFFGLDDQGIKEKSNLILKKYQRYLKTLGLLLFWKREWQPRKSGVMKGRKVPHFHVFIIGLTEDQKKNPEFIAIKLLIKWVQDTGTKNSNALSVALHHGKDGSPTSYRIIHSAKVAIKYVSKYFSKTSTILGHETESIGRTWGYSTGLKDTKYMAGPIQINLDSSESIRFRRFIRKALRLKKSKNFQKNGLPYLCLREQLIKGWSTFAFFPENLGLRWINRFVPDPFKVYEPVPF